MPGFPFPGRPGGEPDEPLLDMIIARRVLPPDAPQPMHDLASMLAALAGPAESGELAGEAAVRAAFSRAASPAGISATARRPGRRRRTRRFRGPARSRARLAAALVVAVAGLGSVFAAYMDVLPSPIQQLAHVTVAAPAPPSSSPRPSGAAGTPLDKHAGNQPSSQPDRRPQQSTSPAQRPGPLTPSPNFKPGSAGRRTTRPSCTPVRGDSPSPQPTPTARPSPPSWSPPVRCTGLPAGPSSVPRLNPYPR
jgi:hypothetical protein